MAGDWIKMRVGLWTHPKVVTLSSRLRVTRCHTIGALHCVWGIADQHADESGQIEMSADALDSLCETPGMTAAMAGVGWISLAGESLQFVDYQAHNGVTGKSRAEASRRQRASRNRHAPVTKKRDQRRGEKKREEKKSIPLPPSLDTPDFREAWAEWESHRQETRKPLTPTSVKRQFADLVKIGVVRSVAAIRHSIAKGYQGIFEPDAKRASGPGTDEVKQGYMDFVNETPR